MADENVAETLPGFSDDAVLEDTDSKQALWITADKDFGGPVVLQHPAAKGVVLLR